MRRVAVTGASGGIGTAILERLRAEGYRVIGLDFREAADPIPGVIYDVVDVREEQSVLAVVERLYAEDPSPVDLVNCAGVVEDDVPAEDMSAEQFDLVMQVNLRGAFLMCREFGRRLLAAGGGSIVNISSMSGNLLVNHPQKQSAYNASKAGLSALTRSLAVEWGGRGVRVNAVSPGYIDTPLNHLKRHMHAQWLEDTVVGRFGRPEEVAGAVAYLMSDDAAYCCGTELVLDGGSSLR